MLYSLQDCSNQTGNASLSTVLENSKKLSEAYQNFPKSIPQFWTGEEVNANAWTEILEKVQSRIGYKDWTQE